MNARYGNGLLAREITCGGMACGPVWYTDVNGFDFGVAEEEEGEEDESTRAIV